MDASCVIRQLRTEGGSTNPYPILALAREAGPVLQDATYTLVTTYALADQVLRSPQFAAAPQMAHASAARIRPAIPNAAVSVLRAEGSGHARMRAVLNPAFHRRRISGLQAMIERCTRELVEPALSRPGTLDFMEAIGYRLPIAVICELLGVPAEARPRMRALARARTVFLEPMPSQDEIDIANAARGEIFAMFEKLVQARRMQPRSDLITELLGGVEGEAEQLSEAELFVNLSLLLIAGFETTAGLLGNVVALLLPNKDTYEDLRANGELIPAFVSEVLRYDPPVQLVTRMAAGSDASIDGVEVPPGNLVMVLIASANRDPARFTDPDAFAPFTRPPSQSLAFGAGPHYCLGAGLAQLEAEVLVQILVGSSARLEAAGQGGRSPERIAIRNFASLPVRVSR